MKYFYNTANEFAREYIRAWHHCEIDSGVVYSERAKKLAMHVAGNVLIGPDDATALASWSKPRLTHFNTPRGYALRAVVWGEWGTGKAKKVFVFVPISILAEMEESGEIDSVSSRQWAEVMGALDGALAALRESGEWQYECPHHAWPPRLGSAYERRLYGGGDTPVYFCGACETLLS